MTRQAVKTSPTFGPELLFGLWKPGLFLACLAVYLRTLAPAFFDDDSAETIAAGATLGLQHPPSYALDTLFVRLASFLPLGGMAFRVNAASGLLGSLTVLLFAQNILFTLDHFLQNQRSPKPASGSYFKVLCAVAGAFLLALSRTFWGESLGAKGGIYLLQALLIQIVYYFFLRHVEEDPRGKGFPSSWFYASVFLFGTGFTNHWQTQAVFLPLLLVFPLKNGPSLKRPRPPVTAKACLAALSFLLLGGSVLLFLPLRSNLHPDWNLGAPDNLSRFLASFFRRYVDNREVGLPGVFFQILQGRSHWGDFFHLARRILGLQGPLLGAHLASDMKIPALALAILGLAGPWTVSGKKVLLSVIAPFAFLLSVFLISLWVPTNVPFHWLMDNYLLPANWMVAFLAAVGLYGLGVSRFRSRTALLSAAAFLLLGWLAWSNFPGLDLECQTLRYDYGANLLKSAPRGAVLLAEADEDYFPVYYFQSVDKKRRDLVCIPVFTLFESWGVAQVERFHPGLGLTASSMDFPDKFSRLIYSTSQVIKKNLGRSVCGFSYFDGALHRFYLTRHPSLLFRKSGVILEFATPMTEKGPWLSNTQFRLRHLTDCPSNNHESLAGIREIYRRLGVGP